MRGRHVANGLGTTRTAWHVIFAALLEERAPPGIDVASELVLTNEPQRADFLLVRRESSQRRDHEARVLRALWPKLSDDTIIEFKSASRPPRRGDWIRLVGYGAQYHARKIGRVSRAQNLTLVLIAPRLTRTLRSEAASMRWTIEDLGGGYYQIHGCEYPSYFVSIDDVAETERDDLIGLFGHRTISSTESYDWLEDHLMTRKGKTMLEDLDGYDEVVDRLFNILPPEERRGGLSRDETILVLDDELLRRLPEEFVATLSKSVRARIRKRLGG